MNRYSSYKDSEVEWIGEIPSGWMVSKYKHHISILSGFPFKSDLFNNETGFPLIRIRDITSGSIETYYSGDYDEDYVVKRDDLLVGMDGDFNIRWWEGKDGLLNQRCCSIKEGERILRRYIFYSLPERLKIINDLTYYTTVKHLSNDDIYNSPLVLPPLSEQHQIVDYLDNKTFSIDSLIQSKEKKITLLKEKRTSLINQVITKGLNPDVEMKDSGVEWIGEIPREWFCVGTNKIFFDLGSGTTPSSENQEYYEDGIHFWITTTDLNEGLMTDTINKLTDKSVSDYPNLTLYKSGSIFISMYGGRIGKIGISSFDSYCNQSVCVLPNNPKVNSRFYYFWFLGFQEQVKMLGRGGGQPNINKEMIKSFPVVKLPLNEQHQIVEFLDRETKLIDETISSEQKKIELLKEYKQSLISEVVTGKRKVVN